MSIYVHKFCIILCIIYMYINCLCILYEQQRSFRNNKRMFLSTRQNDISILRIEMRSYHQDRKTNQNQEIIAISCHFHKKLVLPNFLTPELYNPQTVVGNETIKILSMLLVVCRFRRVKQRQCYDYIRYAVPSRHNVTTPCCYNPVFKLFVVFFLWRIISAKVQKLIFFNATSEVDILGDCAQ